MNKLGLAGRWFGSIAALALVVLAICVVKTPDPVLAQGGTCIDDVSGRTNVCTANDVRIGQLLNAQQITCQAGTTVDLQLRAELVAGSAERYDIGMFVALDGGNARSGTCHRDYLPPPLADQGSYNPGSPLPGPPGGPFYDAELGPDPADECGDLEQGVFTYYDLATVSVPCEDTDGDGFLDVGTCVSWDNNKSQTCLDVNGAIPNTKSKCRCARVAVGNVIVIPGQIRVAKVAQPDEVQEPGADVTFTVTVSNTSQVDVTLESLVDSVYGDLTLYPGSTCVLPQPLAAGDSYTCAFTAAVNGPPGTEVDTVTASGTDQNGGPVSDTATAEVLITDLPPVISVLKSADPTTVWEPGGPVTYTVSVTNGSAPSDPVTLTSLVDDVYGDLADPANGAIYGSTCELVTIAPGATYTCTFQAQVTGRRGDNRVDVVTAVGEDDEGNPARASDDALVVVDFPHTGIGLPPAVLAGGLAAIGLLLLALGGLGRRRFRPAR